MRVMVVVSADAVREVALRQRGGKVKGQLSESFWSCTQADDTPAMMIESRNAIRASSMPAIEVTRPAIIPVSGTFAFTVFFRRGLGVASRFRLSCGDERLFGLCCVCGRFDCFLRLANMGRLSAD